MYALVNSYLPPSPFKNRCRVKKDFNTLSFCYTFDKTFTIYEGQLLLISLLFLSIFSTVPSLITVLEFPTQTCRKACRVMNGPIQSGLEPRFGPIFSRNTTKVKQTHSTLTPVITVITRTVVIPSCVRTHNTPRILNNYESFTLHSRRITAGITLRFH